MDGSVARDLRDFRDRDNLNILLEAVVSRIESGRTNWTPYVLEGYSQSEQIKPFIPRLFALIPMLIEHPDFNYHQRIGLELLILFKKDINTLFSKNERTRMKKVIEKKLHDNSFIYGSYEELLKLL